MNTHTRKLSWLTKTQQAGVYPYPLGAGSARPNPNKGAPETENPLFVAFTALRGGLGLWSQTMVSAGAGPWGRGRSEFLTKTNSIGIHMIRQTSKDIQHAFIP